MVITSLGGGTVRLQNGETVLLVDPTSARLKADATILTMFNMAETPIPEKNVITFPGEYEASGIDIRGFQCGSDAANVVTAYVIGWDGMKILIVGDHDDLPAGEALEEIGEMQPDVVILPMSTADQASWASKLAKSFEAKLILPTTFASTKDVSSAFGEIAETEEKVTFKKKDLASFAQRLVLLSPSK